MTANMILQEDKNCWCRPTADKVTFLIDGAAYFEAFAEVVRRARHTVYIAGWDIDSRLDLDRRGRLTNSPPPLGSFLNQLTKERKSLNIYILVWDFPIFYLMERQWLPGFHLGWKTGQRIHFRLDAEHPLGASLHEKIVVVDDTIAFCGGLDLTSNRWDTQTHDPGDPRRKNADGKRYDTLP